MDVSELDTPFLTINLDAVERNISRAQRYCDDHGFRFRPHIKAHKMPRLAQMQLEAGAVGITCQKLGEAEIMADAGFTDILVTYPLIGPQKIARLAALARRCTITVAADSPEAVAAAGRAAATAGREIGFLVECETGMRRLGVQDAEAAVHLADKVQRTEGLRLRGLMTHPTGPDSGAILAEASRRVRAAGMEVEVVSGGGTPTLYRTHELAGGVITEIRAGEYALGDRAHMINKVVALSDLAATVVATVVGRPTSDRAILDAGSKTLSYDPAEAEPAPGWGFVREYPEAIIEILSEEHAHVDISQCPRPPRIGERVTIVPNHVCSCVNLHDEVALHRSGQNVETARVVARGKIR